MHQTGLNVAIIGMGNLGRAITGYFMGKRTKLNVVAAFDIDPQKVDKVVSRCRSVTILMNCRRLKNELDITIGYPDRPS
ncbi:MAG: hypothetical protein MZV63_05560 [Marinilabiliales bacterium]|nr:hypothetical protein [Marinilabiliales bacterium]